MEGFAFYSLAMEQNGWLNFSGVERKSKGYVAMEIAKRVELWQTKR